MPIKNAIVEIFIGYIRGGCLNQHWFESSAVFEAKAA